MDAVTSERVRAFEQMYRRTPDPWQVRTRWYEQRKIAIILASLPAQRYARVYEPAAGTGELTAALRARCDFVHASEAAETAVARLTERFTDDPCVLVRREHLPEQLPRGQRFDLIVLSEFCYYLGEQALTQLAQGCAGLIAGHGQVLACHWNRDAPDRCLDTARAHRIIARALGGSRVVSHEEPDFLLDIWSAGVPAALPAEPIA